MNSTLQILNRAVYREKLSRDEWKSFAHQAYQRVGNACEICKRGDRRLNVHHIAYKDGANPWEYADTDVIVLCEVCHNEMHAELQKFRQYVFGKLNPQAFKVLNGALAVAMTTYEPLVFAHALAEFVSTPSMVQRYADAWGVVAQSNTVMKRRPK